MSAQCPHSIVCQTGGRNRQVSVDLAWRRRNPDTCLVIRDAECRGVVNPTTMAWRYSYKPRGVDPLTGKRLASRSMTLGVPETHSPDAARTAANQIKGRAKAGDDPAAKRRARVEAERRRRSMTLGRLLEQYTKAMASRPKMRPKVRSDATETLNSTLARLLEHVLDQSVSRESAGGWPRRQADLNSGASPVDLHRSGSGSSGRCLIPWARDYFRVCSEPKSPLPGAIKLATHALLGTVTRCQIITALLRDEIGMDSAGKCAARRRRPGYRGCPLAIFAKGTRLQYCALWFVRHEQ